VPAGGVLPWLSAKSGTASAMQSRMPTAIAMIFFILFPPCFYPPHVQIINERSCGDRYLIFYQIVNRIAIAFMLAFLIKIPNKCQKTE
jgi:hypothetical protein